MGHARLRIKKVRNNCQPSDSFGMCSVFGIAEELSWKHVAFGVLEQLFAQVHEFWYFVLFVVLAL